MNHYLNPFILEEINKHGMDAPTIPTFLQPSFAQAYEDVILTSLVWANQTSHGGFGLIFIEIGANHPVNTSPSYLFERMGVKCVLVEANPKLIPELKKHRSAEVLNYAVTNSHKEEIKFYVSPDNEISSVNKSFVENWKDGQITETITVPTIRINDILKNRTGNIMLSIDVEGHDYEILADIDFDLYQPYIIMIEPSEEFAPGSVKKICSFLRGKGYKLMARTFVNLIFQKT